MQLSRFPSPFPAPLPAALVPDVSGIEAFNAAYATALATGAVFVSISRSGRHWAVKADTLTAPAHTVDERTAAALRDAVARLVRLHLAGPGSAAGPTYVVLYGVAGERRARALATAVHAALCRNPGPLLRLVSRPAFSSGSPSPL
ncbi:hypothetical protein [Streptomyces chattanoogensis]|uniref:Uncharacterized protein n=1 Tax=Streptomyces chattanoogensis TaxID=66876 RepID=A0A0N0XUG2_9ACTN|nr:hypothetical protein [Streptomyces chattanoogensis]KPC60734.1 hypothetical protein ADL29_28275 [Streptomyces chattanoogensis]